ncbi:hypothetical protein YC2023_052220 [Brassica napus]
MTEISTEVCYDSRYGSYSNIGVSAATFQGELNSVCRLLLGVFLTQQRRDCGFFGVLRQWKWYPPEQFYKALSNRSVLLWTWLKTAKFFPWLVVDIAKKKLKDTCNVFCKALVQWIEHPPDQATWRICSREENLLNSGVIRTDMRPGQILDLALGCCEERTEDRPKMILVAKEIKLSKHH